MTNVLLMILDGVRAQNTSIHGYHNETTPFLSSFIERATMYEQARSPGVESLSSHTSILTGYHIPEHGITSSDCHLSDGELIWEQLRNKGYTTGVFSENPFLTKGTLAKDTAYDTVIDWREEYPYPDAVDPKTFIRNGQRQKLKYLGACLQDPHPIGSIINGLALQLESSYPSRLPDRFRTKVSARAYVDAFLDWQANRAGPWAACINLMDAHMPYTPGHDHNLWSGQKTLDLQSDIQNPLWEFNCGHRPLEQLHNLEPLYDGAIHQMDAQIQRVVETLSERNVLDDTLLVVTADHGEGFGEPSRLRKDTPVVAHGASRIHEVLTHVPLVVKYPGQTTGKRIREPATLTRFPGVVKNAIDGAVEPSFVPEDGIVVAHSAGDKTPKIHDKIGEYCDDITPFTGTGRAVYEPEDDQSVTKYATWRGNGVTVSIEDTQSATVVESEDSGVVDRVYDQLSDQGVCRTDNDEIDSATREHLSDLGYA